MTMTLAETELETLRAALADSESVIRKLVRGSVSHELPHWTLAECAALDRALLPQGAE